MNRQELLRKWAELALGECKEYREAKILQPEFYHPIKRTDLTDPVILLSALISAIRARGWHYQLESGYRTVQCEKTTPHGDGAWHGAYVIWELGNRHKRKRAYAAEPCDALLQAYTVALEATEKK